MQHSKERTPYVSDSPSFAMIDELSKSRSKCLVSSSTARSTTMKLVNTFPIKEDIVL